MPDFEATYNLAVSKGGTPPSGRNAEALRAWCIARGGGPGRDAASVDAFISAFSTGFVQYDQPGTYNFTVPTYATLTVNVYGAGGGGGGITTNGWPPGATQFGSVVANAGGGGVNAVGGGAFGASGTASGGTTNTTGGGPAGGVGAWNQSGDKNGTYNEYGGDGGAGGFASRVYSPGQLTPGSTVTIVVAGGGAGGNAGNMRAAGQGNNGFVQVGW